MSKEKNYNLATAPIQTEYMNGIAEEIHNLKSKNIFSKKKIAIVGAWHDAIEIKRILTREGLTLSFIADNNKRRQNVERCGILSMSVEALAREENVVTLIINRFYWHEFVNQFKALGKKESKDFYVLFGGKRIERLSQYHPIGSKVESTSFRKNVEKIKEGWKSHQRIRSKYGDKEIWLMHQPSIGDLYIFSLYLPQYMGVSSIPECDCVLIVTKASTKKLAEAIGFQSIEIISLEDAQEKWIPLIRLVGEEELGIHNAVFHGLDRSSTALESTSDISFAETFQKSVFGFRENVVPRYPKFPHREDVVEKLFQDNRLKVGKTILLSPYAGHFWADVNRKEWEYLANSLIAAGYTVATNCSNETEKPIKGTVGLFIPFADCEYFVEKAGGFIGIRSGFCDVVCHAKAKKTVIYETGAPAGSLTFFGFHSMRIGNDIREVINDCVHTHEIMIDIIDDYKKEKEEN